jgi:hypothetical protein
MFAVGEGGLCIVIATLRQGQRIAALDDMLVETIPEPLAGRARPPSLERRGRRTWQCPHSAGRDMRALNEGSGFDPGPDKTKTLFDHLVGKKLHRLGTASPSGVVASVKRINAQGAGLCCRRVVALAGRALATARLQGA